MAASLLVKKAPIRKAGCGEGLHALHQPVSDSKTIFRAILSSPVS